MLLGRNDVDLNKQDFFGITALSQAYYYRHEGVVRMLWDRGGRDGGSCTIRSECVERRRCWSCIELRCLWRLLATVPSSRENSALYM